MPSTYKRGYLSWNYKDGNSDEIIGVRFTQKSDGPIYVLEEPQTDEIGKPLDNLYVAGIDSIDHAEGDSVVGKDGSKFAITVKKEYTEIKGINTYVCMLKDQKILEQHMKMLQKYCFGMDVRQILKIQKQALDFGCKKGKCIIRC